MVGEMPLAVQYPTLYNIVQRKDVYVSTVLQSNPLNIQFRWSLLGHRWADWLHLVRRLIDIQLFEEPDRVHWKVTNNGIFTVKSMYMNLIDTINMPKSINI